MLNPLSERLHLNHLIVYSNQMAYICLHKLIPVVSAKKFIPDSIYIRAGSDKGSAFLFLTFYKANSSVQSLSLSTHIALSQKQDILIFTTD